MKLLSARERKQEKDGGPGPGLLEGPVTQGPLLFSLGQRKRETGVERVCVCVCVCVMRERERERAESPRKSPKQTVLLAGALTAQTFLQREEAELLHWRPSSFTKPFSAGRNKGVPVSGRLQSYKGDGGLSAR